jgi:curved DNA-binding protein CbpA
MSTLYHILGLPQGATQEQVKAAFRALARRFHPDVNAGSETAEQRFKEVNQAYETLADPGARAAYDRALLRRAVEVRRRRWTFATTAATTFALTTSAIGPALWWTHAKRGLEPVRATVSGPERRGPVIGAPETKQASGEVKGPTTMLASQPASAERRGRGSGWTSYRDARFGFALRFPGDVFTHEAEPSGENVRTFFSRDGGAMLHIFAADNVAGTTLTRYRRSRMVERYAGAVFDQVPPRKLGFVLSGTQGESAFYERVTFACDGRAVHGWQIIFPVSQRALYDLVADEMDRTYTQRTKPNTRCGEGSTSTAGRKAGHDGRE